MRDQQQGSPFVSQKARELGFLFPVAVTRALWDGHVVPSERSRQRGQSEEGRLHDLLWMFNLSARRCPKEMLYFVVLFERKGRSRKETVKAVIGPGDAGKPVITLMLPNED